MELLKKYHQLHTTPEINNLKTWMASAGNTVFDRLLTAEYAQSDLALTVSTLEASTARRTIVFPGLPPLYSGKQIDYNLTFLFNKGFNKQHWTPNDAYVKIYDHLINHLVHEGSITQLTYDYAFARNYNNKGNSIEMLAFWLWNDNLHTMLFTLIVLALAFSEATRNWAPSDFPDFC